jgi:hypothetical protein
MDAKSLIINADCYHALKALLFSGGLEFYTKENISFKSYCTDAGGY